MWTGTNILIKKTLDTQNVFIVNFTIAYEFSLEMCSPPCELCDNCDEWRVTVSAKLIGWVNVHG